jgi:hypothetical protein
MKRFLLFWTAYNTPDGLTWEEWETWHDETKSKFPVQYFIKRELPLLWHRHVVSNLSHAWYFIRCHIWNRYHMVSLANKATGYKWGWIDRDSAILYAAFNIFQDFCEKEKGLKNLLFQYEYSADEESKRVYETAVELYEWWVNGGREKDYKESKRLMKEADESGDMEAWLKAYNFSDTRDNEQLIKLVSIRGYLWT